MSSFTERMIGAATLNIATYEEVEHDRTATGQAAGVVALVAVASVVGAMGSGTEGMVSALVGALASWAVWSAVTYFVGTRMFGGTADWGEMARTIGFAQAPGLLAIFGFIPILGWLIRIVVAIWMLACVIVAIRQALDFTTGRAIGTAVLGFIVLLAIQVFVGLLLGTARIMS
ncbi:YIP1 family protein [Longimicrobium terrae]|uniref:Yip1 domain-containing protein n=1 Tax=Longimicrobium terrae TaxID=1639882 RepID=A0A841GYI0_9BACT|nr:YIP1 family protein [Longimicrobium terrae]MBB4636641.1 hypothetical protein [Longimicrobium terrae]MBB6070835.1 hypothetical protein [Longimicrobium terrae]NNC28861.1 YIP1 family protein [Longimicrobium terrae]